MQRRANKRPAAATEATRKRTGSPLSAEEANVPALLDEIFENRGKLLADANLVYAQYLDTDREWDASDVVTMPIASDGVRKLLLEMRMLPALFSSVDVHYMSRSRPFFLDPAYSRNLADGRSSFSLTVGALLFIIATNQMQMQADVSALIKRDPSVLSMTALLQMPSDKNTND